MQGQSDHNTIPKAGSSLYLSNRCRVLYYPHTSHRRRELSLITTSSLFHRFEQETKSYYCCCTALGTCSAAQGQGEQQQKLFDWQDMAAGSLIGNRIVHWQFAANTRRAVAQAMGKQHWDAHHDPKTIFLASSKSERKGFLYW